MDNKNIVTYNPIEEDKFFFDANIWLYLFCPVGNYNSYTVKKYSDFFLKAIISKSKIYTSSMIISEFFNTYTRIEFNKKKSENPKIYKNYKSDFRNTVEYIELSDGIIEIIKSKILKKAIKINDSFNKIDIDNILKSGSNFDFNDNYFLEICKKNKFKIVTHDKDFLNSDVEIITALKI